MTKPTDHNSKTSPAAAAPAKAEQHLKGVEHPLRLRANREVTLGELIHRIDGELTPRGITGCLGEQGQSEQGLPCEQVGARWMRLCDGTGDEDVQEVAVGTALKHNEARQSYCPLQMVPIARPAVEAQGGGDTKGAAA